MTSENAMQRSYRKTDWVTLEDYSKVHPPVTRLFPRLTCCVVVTKTTSSATSSASGTTTITKTATVVENVWVNCWIGNVSTTCTNTYTLSDNGTSTMATPTSVVSVTEPGNAIATGVFGLDRRRRRV